jgi:hypothetical protein
VTSRNPLRRLGLAWVALLGLGFASTAQAQGSCGSGASPSTVYKTYTNFFDFTGETPLRCGVSRGESGWGYLHIRDRAQQRPDSHVDDPTLSLVIGSVLSDPSSRRIGNDAESYWVVGTYLTGKWRILISEREASPLPPGEPVRDMGIITVFRQDDAQLGFAIDSTGSMADDIAAVRAATGQILDAMERNYSSYQAAVAQYNDPWAALETDFTDNRATITAAINRIGASGGGDWPEYVYSGIITLLDLDWAPQNKKALFVLGDAPPKNPEPTTGYNSIYVLARAFFQNVEIFGPLAGEIEPPLDPGKSALAALASKAANAGDRVQLNFILVGGDSQARAAFQELASGTDGVLIEVATAAEVPGAILAALERAAVGTSALKALYRPENTATQDQEIKPYFQVVNTGDGFTDLSTLKLRYWFTAEAPGPYTVNCSWAELGCQNVTLRIVPVSPARNGANAYLEVGFTPAAGFLASRASTGEIKLRFNDQWWRMFNENDDFSFNAAAVSGYIDSPKVTLYQNGSRIWGQEP